jgi:hypothetical protein
MRHSNLRSILFVAAVALASAVAPFSSIAQSQPQQAQPPRPAVGPYKPVPITLPQAMNDPSFDDFRKQLAEIARKKDRARLAPLVANIFFWVPEDADIADRKLPAIDNLVKALGLDDANEVGWDTLAAYATDSSTMAHPQLTGVFCTPAEAGFDDNAADELAKATQTDATDWVFPTRDGIEVRSAAKQNAPVVEKLGLYLVRVLPDDSPVLTDFAKVLTPSGKVGFVPVESVVPVGGEQLCYVKDTSGWKIVGFLGGDPNH